MQTILYNQEKTESKLRIGYAFCGSFCTLTPALEEMKKLVAAGHTVTPILSEAVASTDTRFHLCADFCRAVEEAAGRPAIRTIPEAEPIGPKEMFDLLILSPCTGNTLAKLANGITDAVVPMAAKSHLRTDRPLLIALATNDALSQNLQNLAKLLLRKAVSFLPMRQDAPAQKPHSLVADYPRMGEALAPALEGRQLQPLFL